MSTNHRDPRSVPTSDPPDDHLDGPHVALVAWPRDEALRRRLAAARAPRLLLIDAGSAPPTITDELEDWVREPLDPDELAVRIATLVERARGTTPRAVPVMLDADGVLHAKEVWVALAPLEARVLAIMLERPGAVCHRADLVRAAWPDGFPADARALDGVVMRLRRRVAPLGVRIHTVARQGFLLGWAEGDQPDAGA